MFACGPSQTQTPAEFHVVSAHSALGTSLGNSMLVHRTPDLLRLLGPGQKKPKTATPNEVTDSEDPTHTFRNALGSGGSRAGGDGVCVPSQEVLHTLMLSQSTPSFTQGHSTAGVQREGPGGDPGCCGVRGPRMKILYC